MELICINSDYDAKTLEVFSRNSITYPKIDEIVTLLRIEKYPRLGRIGLIVAPYQEQYIRGSVAGIEGDNEVSFNSKRFVTLLGSELTSEMLKNWQKEEKNSENLVEKTIKPKKNV
jgi:hypothetical protein